MQIRLEERPLHDVAMDRGLASRISQITAESYTNPEVLLGQEYQKNNQVYLVWSEESELIAFFMVGWSEIVLGNGPVPCVFLGLSAVAAEHKGVGLGATLYRRFFTDAAQKKHPVYWWFHSASPIVAGLMWRVAPNIGPDASGSLTEEQLGLAKAVATHHGMLSFQDPALPCVLRNYAKARYAMDETNRLGARRRKKPSLFDQWKIDETAGDRILFVGKSMPLAV